MVSKNVKNNEEDKNISNILSEICKGEKKTIEFSKKNPNFHWSNVIIPRTKETPLHLAAQFGHTEIVSFLLNEFDPKIVDIRNIDNKTPLHEAAQFGRFDCVKILVDCGADIDAIKRSDWTPLMLACTKPESNYKDIVEYLGNKGNNNSSTYFVCIVYKIIELKIRIMILLLIKFVVSAQVLF